jgi:hypothetical protein
VNVDELWPLIVATRRDHSFDLRHTAMPEHQSSDQTPVYFDTEGAACAFGYARATEPEPVAHATTSEQDRRAADLAVEGETRRRQMLIDAGYDPETLRKR